MMRRKTVILTPAPSSLCFPQAADRFQRATLILQQIAARLDAAGKAQAEAQEGARKVNAADKDTTS